jgi:hypothetical protein
MNESVYILEGKIDECDGYEGCRDSMRRDRYIARLKYTDTYSFRTIDADREGKKE